MDLYSLLNADDDTAAQQAAAMTQALRKQQAVGTLGVLSGDKVLGNLGQGLIQQSEKRADQLGDLAGQRLRNAMTKQRYASQEAAQKAQLAMSRERLNMDRQRLEQDSFQLVPDGMGGFARVNKRTGAYETGLGGGQAGGAGGDFLPGLKLTEAQSKAFAAANRIREGRAMMKETGTPTGMRGRLDAWATGASGGPMRWLTPQEFATSMGQGYYTAARNIIAALLRKESGAAITREEWDELGPLYVAMPWDNADTRAKKERLLDIMEKSAIMESGPAASRYLQQQAAQVGLPAAPGGPRPGAASAHEQPGMDPLLEQRVNSYYEE